MLRVQEAACPFKWTWRVKPTRDYDPHAMSEHIGRYRITGKLGEGGMGVVYAAVDDRLERPIALKVIRRETTDDAARERFWREARLAASVNHPHICQLYEIGEADGQLFIAMERLEGEGLAALLARGPLPVAETVRLGLQLLDALSALHGRGIVHRDLKPSNVFLTHHGIRLLDFGLARPAASGLAVTQGITVTGAIVGTPRYMAPEQLQGSPLDARVDLFATGAILYEMLSGRPAFDAAPMATLIEQILHGDQPVLGGSPAIAAADRVIHRALAKAPDQRYASAAAMADDLRTVLVSSSADEPTRARPVTRLIVMPFRLLRDDAEISFLAFSLADAITNSLSSLESLVVRSTLAAARLGGNADLKTIASEADVEVVLTGTLLRAGDQLRVSTQLVEAPAGTVLWSETSQASVGDVFRLQDDLSKRIVESLALPLSGREKRALTHDVPSSAKAYEFYLRGNQLSHDPVTWELARDLYRQSVEADPRYAPAWARLGRIYRVIRKYSGGEENLARAESALNQALELNPDLAIADHFYAQIDLERGRAPEAMVRLIRRASSRSSDPELFAALVSLCRYCGLLDASFAAHRRAKRLDPNVRTSIQHTFFMAGNYLGAAAETGPIDFGVMALACLGHPDTVSRFRADSATWPDSLITRRLSPHLLAVIEGHAADLAGFQAAIDAIIASGFRDPEALFYWALGLARAGGHDPAVSYIARSIDWGFFPYDTFARHAWLDPLRDRPDFKALLRTAERRDRDAHAAFVQAGGETLLGVEETRG
jgi:serine/threonine protein kinase